MSSTCLWLARSDLEYSEPGLTNVNYVLGSVITADGGGPWWCGVIYTLVIVLGGDKNVTLDMQS